ncbi:MAG TPA: MlaD family protein [Solirubrobacterales bacterium]|nr:MlaD family protein [Solirubrobacterales bacterium]
MRERRFQSLAANPTLVGALTVLIVVVAVFLAYNANNGLPFVPTYRISANVPNANSLVEGNEVRVGGVRVGVVETIAPVEHDNGAYTAKLDLKLDKSVDPLPENSSLIVRSRSALGLKFLEITPGTSDRGIPEGGSLSLAAARPEPVELDQVFNMFQEGTRRDIQVNLREFGTAVAGRGPQINAAIGELAPLLRRLEPVMRNLSSEQTDLAGFFRALEQSAAEAAPVAETQARMFVVLDQTFSALAAVSRPFIQDTITRGLEAENAALETMPRIRPFLRHSALLFSDLEPGVRALAANSPALASAFTIGTPTLRASPILNAQLTPTAQALLDFSRNDDVRSGLDALRRTAGILDPTLRFLTPAQTVCNYGTLTLRNAGEIVGTGNSRGKWFRVITILPPVGRNSESGPASRPGNGPERPNHLHYNPYPNTAAPGQPLECEAGNEPYLAGRTVIGNVSGNQGTVTASQEEGG